MKWNCDNLKTLSIREIFDSEIKLRRFKNFVARKNIWFYYFLLLLCNICSCSYNLFIFFLSINYLNKYFNYIQKIKLFIQNKIDYKAFYNLKKLLAIY